MNSLLLEAHKWVESSWPKAPDLSTLSIVAVDSGFVVDSLCSDAEIVVRYAVTLLGRLSMAAPSKSDIISIALDDMRTVSYLLRIIDCFGIYPILPNGLGLPVEELTDWTVSKNSVKYTPDFGVWLAKSLVEVVSANNDVSDLVLISPMFPDLLALCLMHKEYYFSAENRVHTRSLYKHLLRLMRPNAPHDISRFLAKRLACLPLKRNDAVRGLVAFSMENESNHMDKVVAILAAIPKDTDPQIYIKAIGMQFFETLSSPGAASDLVSSIVIIVEKLAQVRPGILGILRDKLIAPLTNASQDLEPALLVLCRMAEHPGKLFHFVASKTAQQIWLFLAYIVSQKRQNESILKLLTAIFNCNTACAINIIDSLMAESWNGLAVTEENGVVQLKEIAVVSTLDKTLDLMNPRLSLLFTILDKTKDKIISEIFIELLAKAQSQTSTSALEKLIETKTLEQFMVKYRERLFEKPEELIRLTQSILMPLTADVPQLLDSKGLVAPLGDSDDEDEELGGNCHSVEASPYMLANICLSLLSALVLEFVANESLLDCISQQRELIKKLRHIRDLRKNAEQCLNIIDTVVIGLSQQDDNSALEWSNQSALRSLASNSLKSPLVPDRAYGLSLTTKLLLSGDHFEFNDIMEALSKALADDDSYVYLNAVKALAACADVYGVERVGVHLLNIKSDMETHLRARESLLKIVKMSNRALPPSLTARLVNELLFSIRPVNKADDRLRASALSLLASLLEANPLGLSETMESEILDNAMGVLQFENQKEKNFVQRAALVLLLAILNSNAEGAFRLVVAQAERLQIILNQLRNTSSDEVILGHVNEISSLILSTQNF